MKSKHSIIESFGFAIDGVRSEFKKGRNFKIQAVLGVIAIVIGFILKLEYTEWAILIFTISSVLVLELINTAIETTVDLASPEIREKAKLAKDTAAATVLIASVASVIIGAFLFLPKLWT